MKTQYCKEREDACDSPTSMWKRCKWSQNWTPRDSYMPALHSHPTWTPESCPKVKAQILIDRFFSPPPVVDLSDIKKLPHYHPSYHTGKINVKEIHSLYYPRIYLKKSIRRGWYSQSYSQAYYWRFITPFIPDLQCLSRHWIPSHTFPSFSQNSSSQIWQIRLYSSQSISPYCSLQ